MPARGAGSWASSLFGFVGRDVYGVTVVVGGYRGTGAYDQKQASVPVHRPDNRAAVWQSVADDPVRFTVSDTEESGTVDATLSNLGNGKTKLKVAGRWSCRT